MANLRALAKADEANGGEHLLTDEERRRRGVHEAGHALLASIT